MARPARILFAALFAILSVYFLLARAGIESRILPPSIMISPDSLYAYYLAERPAVSLDSFAAEMRDAGLRAVLYAPLTVAELSLTGDLKVRSWDRGTAVIDAAPGLRVVDDPGRIERAGNSAFRIAVSPGDLGSFEFGYKTMDLGDLPAVFLKKNYQKKAIDGYFDPAGSVEYGRENLPPPAARNLFESDDSAASLVTIGARYGRAFAERKNGFFIVPFFGRALEKDPSLTLRKILGRIAAVSSSPSLQVPDWSAPRRLGTWLKFLLLISAFSILGIPLKFGLPAAVPGLFTDLAPWLTDVYLVLLFALFARKALLESLKEGDGPLNRILATLLQAACGIAALSALGTDPRYLTKTAAVHGVTLAVFLAFGLACFEAVKASLRARPSAGAVLWIGFCATGLAAAALSVGRSYSLIPSSGLENMARDTIDTILFARPRFKELLFGYPLLAFALFAFRKGLIGPVARNAALLLAATAWISSLNTFLHFQSFLAVSLFRTAVDMAAGCLLGWLAFILYSWSVAKFRAVRRT